MVGSTVVSGPGNTKLTKMQLLPKELLKNRAEPQTITVRGGSVLTCGEQTGKVTLEVSLRGRSRFSQGVVE